MDRSESAIAERGADAVNDLFHYGVKGMKWGVRKDDSGAKKPRGKIRRGLTKLNVATDAGADVINKGEKKLIFLPLEKRQKAAEVTQQRVLGVAMRVNKDPRFKGKDIKRDPELKKAYYKEVEKEAIKIYKEELTAARAEAAVDLVFAVADARRERLQYTVPKNTVRHADEDPDVLLTLNFDTDKLGHIQGVQIEGDDLGHGEIELAHYGVKGMKWGVRKDRGHEGERVKTKKLAKLDKKWEQENTGVRGYIKVHNAVADRMNNGEIDRFNNEPRWKKAADDGVLNDDNHPETKAYFDAYETLTNKMFAEETVKLGMNPSGSKAYELREDAEGNPFAYLAPVKKSAQHAEGDTQMVFRINRDAKGLVTDLSEAEVELKHYGVKGMKWGVRKDRSPVEVTTTSVPGKRVKATGGKNQPASEDAKTAAANRQKAKASTTDALSNAELKQLVNRMQLEQQYADLSAKRNVGVLKTGHNFVKNLLGYGRTANEVHAFANSPAGKQMKSEFSKRKQK